LNLNALFYSRNDACKKERHANGLDKYPAVTNGTKIKNTVEFDAIIAHQK
jgi:hypothetical protein